MKRAANKAKMKRNRMLHLKRLPYSQFKILSCTSENKYILSKEAKEGISSRHSKITLNKYTWINQHPTMGCNEALKTRDVTKF